MTTDVTQDLANVYRGSTPGDVTATTFGQDIAYSQAAMMAMVHEEVSRLDRGSKLSTSVGAFTNLHLRDRGLSRQDGETDAQAIARAQNPPKAGTVPAILASVQAIIGDPQTSGEAFMIELPRQSAYFDQLYFFDASARMGGGRGVVIVLIPASANARASVTDAVRTKVSAGKLWLIEEYVIQ